MIEGNLVGFDVFVDSLQFNAEAVYGFLFVSEGLFEGFGLFFRGVFGDVDVVVFFDYWIGGVFCHFLGDGTQLQIPLLFFLQPHQQSLRVGQPLDEVGSRFVQF